MNTWVSHRQGADYHVEQATLEQFNHDSHVLRLACGDEVILASELVALNQPDPLERFAKGLRKEAA